MNIRLLKEFQKDQKTRKLAKEKSAPKNRKKRLSSEEFLKFQEDIWKPGPQVRYQSPDKWYKKFDHP